MKLVRGFTLVEIIVTMVVMTILMALGTVAISGQQAQARDKERQSDIDVIARGLEARYTNGNPKAVSSDGQTDKGVYSSTNEIQHAMGTTKATYDPTQIAEGYLTDLLPGLTESALNSPKMQDALTLVCSSSCAAAGNQTQLTNAFNNQDKYVYEPVDASGNICHTTACYKFNLYWRSDNGTINKITSKHQ